MASVAAVAPKKFPSVSLGTISKRSPGGEREPGRVQVRRLAAAVRHVEGELRRAIGEDRQRTPGLGPRKDEHMGGAPHELVGGPGRVGDADRIWTRAGRRAGINPRLGQRVR